MDSLPTGTTGLHTNRTSPSHSPPNAGNDILGLSQFSLFNVRGLKPLTTVSKVPAISDMLKETNQIFISLSETWLDEHKDEELSIDGYVLLRGDRKYRKKRKGRGSGGVAIYIRTDIASTAETILTFSNGLVEVIGVLIKSLNLVVYSVYRSPNNTKGLRSGLAEFQQALAKIQNSLDNLPEPTPDIIVNGDFNLPNADWVTGNCAGKNRVFEEQEMVSALFNFMRNNFMSQHVEVPTHIDNNVLDLIFTNNDNFIHSLNACYSGLSDHKVIEVRVKHKTAEKKPKSQTEGLDETINEPLRFYNLNFFNEEIDWQGLHNKLKNHDWNIEFINCDPKVMYQRFMDVCLLFASEFVPERRHKKKRHTLIPRDRRILMRTRRRIHRSMANTKSEPRREALKKRLIEIEKRLVQSHKDEQRSNEENAVKNIKINSKYFYSYAKTFSKIRIGIGPLIDAKNQLVSCAKKMSEMLSEQYSSVFSTPIHPVTQPEDLFPDEDVTEEDLNDVPFSEADIMEAIQELKINSAAGPDGFPAIFLRKCSQGLAKPLAMMWRQSLNTGVIPQKCKFSNIIPIHKGKSRALPKNYRPVALTSLIIKIFEKVLRKYIVQYMSDHRLFNTSQHGFRCGRSCLSQLLAHFDHVTRLLEEGKAVDVIYLDFSKAFDKVDIGVTLRKLNSLGIKGKLGRWLQCFLTGRMQSVMVDGNLSNPKPVLSGVPQGSVLGPLIFLVLIGDIDLNIVSSFMSSFADDTRVGHGISNKADSEALQHDLKTVYQWAKTNNMEFNSDKFEMLHYPSDSTPNEAKYAADDLREIEEKDSLRDLGITMSNSATFSEHINKKVQSMLSKCGWILRTFKARKKEPMMTLWKSLVLSDHDYCSQLWSPHKKGDIQSLELVQRNFLRKIQSLRDLSYWEQLKALKLYSLERRRERYIAIYTWKIIEEHVPNISNDHGVCHKWHQRRGRVCKVPAIKTSASCRVQTIRFSSFAVNGPRVFNSLPSYLRNLTGVTVGVFKRQLDKYLAGVPDEPLIPGYTAYRQMESNSLIDWAQHARQQPEEPAAYNVQQEERVDRPGSP